MQLELELRLEKTLTLDDIECERPILINPDLLLKNDKVSFSDGCVEYGLIEEKYGECTGTFIESLIEEGQKAPALIAKSDSGYFFMNGHHRLAVAVNHDLELLIMIVPPEDNAFTHWDSSESDDFPDSGSF